MAYADLPHAYYVAAADITDLHAQVREAAAFGFPSGCVAAHPDDILPRHREGRALWHVDISLPAPVIEEVPGGWAAADRTRALLRNYERASALTREYITLMRRGRDHQGQSLAFTLNRAVELGAIASNLAAAERTDVYWAPLGWDGYQATAAARELSRDL